DDRAAREKIGLIDREGRGAGRRRLEDLDAAERRRPQVERGAAGFQRIVAGAAVDAATGGEIALIDGDRAGGAEADLELLDAGKRRAAQVERGGGGDQRIRPATALDRAAGRKVG